LSSFVLEWVSGNDTFHSRNEGHGWIDVGGGGWTREDMEGLDDHLEQVVEGKRRISLADGQGGEELDENSEGGTD